VCNRAYLYLNTALQKEQWTFALTNLHYYNYLSQGHVPMRFCGKKGHGSVLDHHSVSVKKALLYTPAFYHLVKSFLSFFAFSNMNDFFGFFQQFFPLIFLFFHIFFFTVIMSFEFFDFLLDFFPVIFIFDAQIF